MPRSPPRPVVERMSGAKRHRGETEPRRTRRARAGSETRERGPGCRGLTGCGSERPRGREAEALECGGSAGRCGALGVVPQRRELGLRARPRRKRLDFSDAARPGSGHRPGRGAQAQPASPAYESQQLHVAAVLPPCSPRGQRLGVSCAALARQRRRRLEPRGGLPGLPAPRRPPRPLSFGLPRESGLGTVPAPRGRSQAWPRRCLAETQRRATGWPPGQVSADCCVKARE